MFKNVDKSKPLFMDIESHGLYLEIAMVQAYQKHWDEPQFLEYPNPKKLFQFVRKAWIVGHNLSYDLGTIAYQAGRKKFGTNLRIDDTFYAARIAFPSLEKYSLDVMHDLLDLSYYNPKLDKKKMQKSFVYAEAKKRRKATDDQIQYALADVLTTCELFYNKAVKKIRKSNRAYWLDVKSLVLALNYQQNGIPVNRALLHKEQEALKGKIEANKEILGDLNPQSPKQVCEFLGEEKSDKPTLVRLISEGNKMAKVVFDQRRLLKAKKMLDTWDCDRVYTFFNPAGAASSRFTSTGGDVEECYINAQQISRQYQHIFHNPDPDTVTFEIDYSTVELRVGAAIMGDKTMRKELKKGKDLHIEAAKMIGIKKPTKEDRTKGKAVNFGLIFGMGPGTFQSYAFESYGVKFSQKESRDIHRSYHRKYRGIDAFHRNVWATFDEVPVETAMGHRNKPARGTIALNFGTQGSTAEATKLAVYHLVKKYPDALKYVINIVHDACYMEVPKTLFKTWSMRLEWAMQEGYKDVQKSKLLKFDDIPVGTEVEIIGGER